MDTARSKTYIFAMSEGGKICIRFPNILKILGNIWLKMQKEYTEKIPQSCLPTTQTSFPWESNIVFFQSSFMHIQANTYILPSAPFYKSLVYFVYYLQLQNTFSLIDFFYQYTEHFFIFYNYTALYYI